MTKMRGKVDPARSAIMKAVRQKNTEPELFTRRLLHSLGLRFRLHVADLPGRPDIVLPKHKTVIFVHGCFWHRHPGCVKASCPKTRVSFWTNKFETNVARDKEKVTLLRKKGWRVLTVWECETKNPTRLLGRLRRLFRA